MPILNDQQREAASLLREGHTTSSVADEVGVNRRTITKWMDTPAFALAVSPTKALDIKVDEFSKGLWLTAFTQEQIKDFALLQVLQTLALDELTGADGSDLEPKDKTQKSKLIIDILKHKHELGDRIIALDSIEADIEALKEENERLKEQLEAHTEEVA